jgi:hypothetical protein
MGAKHKAKNKVQEVRGIHSGPYKAFEQLG